MRRIEMHRLAMLPDGTISRPLLQYLKEHPNLDYASVDVDAGHYTGSILWVDQHHVVQNLGRNQIAVHKGAQIGVALEPYQRVAIRYSDGQATVTPTQQHTQRPPRPR